MSQNIYTIERMPSAEDDDIFRIYHSRNELITNEEILSSSDNNNNNNLDDSRNLRRRLAINSEQFQRKFNRRQRLRLALLHYFRSDSIARFIFILICIVWFWINFITVFSDFLTFDTIVYMEYRTPKHTRPPGITFCTHCIYCRYSNNQSKKNKMLVYKAIENNIDDDYILDYDYENDDKDDKNDKDDEALSLNLTDFINYCRFYPNALDLNEKTKSKFFNCSDLAPVVVSMQEGHKCFTFFSDIFGDISRLYNDNYGQDNTKENLPIMMDFDQFPFLEINIKGKYLQSVANGQDQWHSNSLFDNSEIGETIGIFIVLHSPTILADMLSLSYHRIFPRKYTQIQFIKMTEKRKPRPYRTKCFDYNRLVNITPDDQQQKVFREHGQIEQKDLKLFRSRGECFLYCMWRYLGHNEQCLNFYTIFTGHLFSMETQCRTFDLLQRDMNEINEQWKNRWKIMDNITDALIRYTHIKFCSINDSFQQYGQIKRKCLENCPTECFSETFWIDTSYNLDMNLYKNDSLIRIEWSTEPVAYIEHREKFTTSSFLGNIGGHAHIWLGISIIAICRFIIESIQSRSSFHIRCSRNHLWFIRFMRGFHSNSNNLTINNDN
uniref:Uncharacterized protein LOC113798559 n=1 Tax=Dermatophagoides pteronyssinus TaxID=6956 RepID=A0A6P6YI58_DERPT